MSKVVTQLRIPGRTVDEVSGVVIGMVQGVNEEGQPLVSWGQDGRQALPAHAVWLPEQPDWSGCKDLRVVLGFEEGDMTKPILLGLLNRPPLDRTAVKVQVDTDETKEAKPKVLRLESEQELVLECGKAKISLRADGRVVILGGYILSRSKGINKIKGGAVQIN